MSATSAAMTSDAWGESLARPHVSQDMARFYVGTAAAGVVLEPGAGEVILCGNKTPWCRRITMTLITSLRLKCIRVFMVMTIQAAGCGMVTGFINIAPEVSG